MSYLRIAAHPHMFATPLSAEEPLANISAITALPHVRTISELDGFLDPYRLVTGDMPDCDPFI
jgi:hypothetical protein